MAPTSPTELWRQADSILDQLLDLDQDQRHEELYRLTSPGLLRERVEHLLAAMERPGILDQTHFSGLESATEKPCRIFRGARWVPTPWKV